MPTPISLIGPARAASAWATRARPASLGVSLVPPVTDLSQRRQNSEAGRGRQPQREDTVGEHASHGCGEWRAAVADRQRQQERQDSSPGERAGAPGEQHSAGEADEESGYVHVETE